MRYDAYGKAVGITGIDGQTDAVYSNRALANHISCQRFGNVDGYNDRIGQGLPLSNSSNTVDMPRHQVPVDPIGKSQGPFDIHRLADFGLAEGRRLKGFGGNVNLKMPTVDFNCRQAGTADAKAVTDFRLVQIKISFNCQASSLAG